ncbi:glycosyltransferase family 2 protein [Echinicola marina]|uniref:glycosyltransferase family 2 protein n=1 Tax=Echinicola marina TaxID=2859768 RepID=UPI001CF62A79|nr:glycosyltransferase family A protein [Echinicola marina]UCS91998.1 glycosyltransferase family 2 protein [Echinicola marina]
MFSVIIPLYNKAPYICRAIESVLQQSYRDFEIIVVNDGSSDGGEQLVEERYGSKVVLIHQANQGVSVARNNGISQAKGEYIAFLDADDLWHPMYLTVIKDGITRFPQAGVWGSSYSFYQKELSFSGEEFHLIQRYFDKAIVNTLFFTSAMVISKRFFDENIGFKEYLKRGEDLDVLFRAVLTFGSPAFCKARLVCYEQGDVKSATNVQFDISSSLLCEIGRNGYLRSSSIESKDDFNQFKIKYIYFNLFQYYLDSRNFREIRRIINHQGNKYFLGKIVYFIPSVLMKEIVKVSFLKKQLRNYLKFCFRVIYG